MSLFERRYNLPGTAPGTFHKDASGAPARLSVIDYDGETLAERLDTDLATCREHFESPRTTWIHVQGLPDEALLRELGEAYGLHALALEDVIHTGQRTKLEHYEDQHFMVLNRLLRDDEQGTHAEQVSVFLGGSWVVSIHDGDEDLMDPIRRRLRGEGSGRIRKRGPDYLAYAITDLVVDQAFPILEAMGSELEEMEETVLYEPERQVLDRIHYVKRELLTMRRQVWPQREVLNALLRDDSPLIMDGTLPYLRDCYDHTVQIMDLVDSYREMSSSLLEVYLSSLSNRMNEVMKVLTIIATIFIPLSFIVGLYGMNFDPSASPWNMPELGAYYGYPVLILVLVGIIVGMLLWFRRKGWF